MSWDLPEDLFLFFFRIMSGSWKQGNSMKIHLSSLQPIHPPVGSEIWAPRNHQKQTFLVAEIFSHPNGGSRYVYMGVSKNHATPKWMVSWKTLWTNGWFGEEKNYFWFNTHIIQWCLGLKVNPPHLLPGVPLFLETPWNLTTQALESKSHPRPSARRRNHVAFTRHRLGSTRKIDRFRTTGNPNVPKKMEDKHRFIDT